MLQNDFSFTSMWGKGNTIILVAFIGGGLFFACQGMATARTTDSHQQEKKTRPPIVIAGDRITKDIEIENTSGRYLTINVKEYIDNELVREAKDVKLSHRKVEGAAAQRVYRFNPLWEEHDFILQRKIISPPRTDRSGAHECKIIVEEAGGGFRVEKAIKFGLKDKVLNVARVQQLGERWCWAASLQAIVNYMGDTDIRACELVNRARESKWFVWETGTVVRGRVDCCQEGPTGQGCDFGLPLDSWRQTSLSDVVRLKGYSMRYLLEAPMSDGEIRENIDAGKPLIIMVAPHIIVARGYRLIEDEDGQRKLYLHVMDPLLYPHYMVVAYEDFIEGRYLGMPWVGVIYDIRRSNVFTDKERMDKVKIDVPSALTDIPFQARLIGLPSGRFFIDWSSTAAKDSATFVPLEEGVVSEWTISKAGKYMIIAKIFSDREKKQLLAKVISDLFEVNDLKPLLQCEIAKLSKEKTHEWEEATTVIDLPIYSANFGKPLRFSLMIRGLDVERMSISPLWQYTDKNNVVHGPKYAAGPGMEKDNEFIRMDFEDLLPHEVNIKKGQFLIDFAPKEYKGSYAIQAIIKSDGKEVRSNIIRIDYGEPLRLTRTRVRVGESFDAYIPAPPEKSANIDYAYFLKNYHISWRASDGLRVLPAKKEEFNSRTLKALKAGTHWVTLELFRPEDNFKISYTAELIAEGEMKVAGEEEAEAPEAPSDSDVKSAMLKEIEAYINQFKNTCFGQYISLGDLKLFRDGANRGLRLIVGEEGAKLIKERKISKAYHYTWEYMRWVTNADLVLPFDPRNLSDDPAKRFEQRQTMFHEMTHHLEWLSGVKIREKPRSDRNCDYQDRVVNRLRQWVDNETRIREKKDPPESQFKMWQDLWLTLRELEAGSAAGGIPPDDNLQAINGFRARFDDIRQAYFSGKCGKELQRLASLPANFEVLEAAREKAEKEKAEKEEEERERLAREKADRERLALEKAEREEYEREKAQEKMELEKRAKEEPVPVSVMAIPKPAGGAIESSKEEFAEDELEGDWITLSGVFAPEEAGLHFSKSGNSYTGTLTWKEGNDPMWDYRVGDVVFRLTRVSPHVYKGEQRISIQGNTSWSSHTYGVKGNGLWLGDAITEQKPDSGRLLAQRGAAKAGAQRIEPMTSPETMKINLRVEKIFPGGASIVVGGKAQFKATVIAGSAEGISFQWQPHPEVEFSPFEKSPTTTATFRRPGTYKIYVQALKKEGPRYVTVGESNQVEVTVTNPAWKLSFELQHPLIGQELKARIGLDVSKGVPLIDMKEMNFRWQLPQNARQTMTSADDREITFYLIDNKSAKISCLASTKYHNDNLGGAGKTITAKSYDLAIIGPKPRQEFQEWRGDTQLGQGQSAGMKQVENIFVTDQEILFSSKIFPTPPKPVSYNWTASPEGCTFLSNGGNSTSIICSSAGSYTVKVTARMDGMEIGSATTSVSVMAQAGGLTGTAKEKKAKQEKMAAKAQETRREPVVSQKSELEIAREELKAASARYTKLVTEGGEGDVEEALAAYKKALDRVEELESRSLKTPVKKKEGVDAGPIRIDETIREPRKLVDVAPEYPAHAVLARQEGIVILDVVIDVQGNVKDIKVIRSIPGLDQAAIDAVKQWKYEPTIIEGKPREIIMTVTVSFSLKQKSPDIK